MTDLLRLIVLVPLAYIAACIAAGAVVAVAVFGPAEGEHIGLVIGTGFLATMWAGALSFVPALIAVILAEAFGWRSVLYYLAVGGGIALAGNWFAEAIGPPELADRRLTVLLASGFAAGLVYWLLAGRLAGVRRPEAP